MSNSKIDPTSADPMSPQPRPVFQISDSLPLGRTTMLEASAGTGKTYALAALTVRFVAEEGIPIAQVLLVTFTRAATAELKDRIRDRLADAAAHLAEPIDTDDPLLVALANTTSTEVAIRRERLERAVTDYDTAQIHTIHGFCAQVRESLGVLADLNTEAVPTESESALIQEVCADLIFTEASKRTLPAVGAMPDGSQVDIDAFPALPTVGALVKNVQKARTLGDCVITAESGQPSDLLNKRLLEFALQEVADRTARSGGLSFDSLLSNVRDAVRSDAQLVQDVRGSFKVALIDEFQDTDPVQWEIFSTLFGSGTSSSAPSAASKKQTCTLVLVGDPKQAIYSFRGGDVYTYLAATGEASEVLRLGTNQRSDAAAVQAMNALGQQQCFGESQIAYQQVESSPRHARRTLISSESERTLPGLVLRCVLNTETSGLKGAKLASGPVRKRIAADLAEVAERLLTEGVIKNNGAERRVHAGDIAVLLSGKAQAPEIAQALKLLGIPAVLRMQDNVADSDAADQWRTLFYALDRPAATNRATAAAFTWFFGWTAEEVAAAIAEEDQESQAATELAHLQRRLMDWSELIMSQGMAALFGAVRADSDESRVHKTLIARVLSAESGERNLTDVEHVAELIHAEARSRGRGLSAAAALLILDGLGGAGSGEVASEAAQRRVESEADAVQIMTIHGSKGLEFPIVLLPELWSGGLKVQDKGELTFYSKEQKRRVLDVSTKGQDGTEFKGQTRAAMAPEATVETIRQNCGDQQRMTYVALTRAIHQSVVWWAPIPRSMSFKTGLGRMLFNDDPDLSANATVDCPSDATIEFLTERFAARNAAEVIEVVEVKAPKDAQSAAETDGPGNSAEEESQLAAATLGRSLDREAFRWSYSSLQKKMSASKNADAEADPTDSRSEDSGAQDEEAAFSRLGSDPQADMAAAELTQAEAEKYGWTEQSPYRGLGGGIPFGNLLHELFENLDFTAQDLPAEIEQELLKLTRHQVTDLQLEKLPQVLANVIGTPFGPQFGGLSLRTLQPKNRLNEMQFNLALSQGKAVSAAQIGKVISAYLPQGDPFKKWADGLATRLSHVKLQGYLSGSIDLTLRYEVEGDQKYSVVDYKTNQLSPRGPEGSLLDYHPTRLPAAMAHSQYTLQALLYTVALHRYLRWRLPGYKPEINLGPVGYLFVRGMVGPTTPTASTGAHHGVPAGVFCWQPPVEMIQALSAMLAGSTSQAVAS